MIYLITVVMGAFGAAFLRLFYEQPRDVCFILMGVTFLCLGMKKSPFAKAVLVKIRNP